MIEPEDSAIQDLMVISLQDAIRRAAIEILPRTSATVGLTIVPPGGSDSAGPSR